MVGIVSSLGKAFEWMILNKTDYEELPLIVILVSVFYIIFDY